jgi:hypothetical protein
MEIPSLDELIERRKMRKHELRAALNGNKNYKKVFKIKERLVENYINDQFDKLEEVDQKIIKDFGFNSTFYPFLSILPPVGIIGYIYSFNPTITRVQKLGLCVPIFLIPLWALSTSAYNQARIEYYLVEKYTKILTEQSKNLRNKMNPS